MNAVDGCWGIKCFALFCFLLCVGVEQTAHSELGFLLFDC